MTEQTTCAKCQTSFQGSKTSHCCGCHETFSSITAFDKHQRPSGAEELCKSPELVGLVRHSRTWGEVWGFPAQASGFWAHTDRTTE
jgi:hypothetical protein